MKHFVHLLAALVCATSLSAQEVEAKEDDEVKGRMAWFVTTGIPEDMENPVKVLSGKQFIEVTLSKRSPSMPVKVPKDGILQVVRKVENPEDPDKPKYHILAHTLVPEGVSNTLVILMPVENDPKGLAFHSRVVDLANFKGGSWMFLNTSPVKVGVELGKTKAEINPGETKMIVGKKSSDPTNMTIRYFFKHPEKAEWKILNASTVVVYPTRREICIFGWDKRYNRMNYHGITFPVME